MNVGDYLAGKDIKHEESDWLDFYDVLIPSGQMAISDPALYPGGLVVPVRPGLYHVQVVVVVVESGHHVISRLRAFCHSTYSLADKIGDVSVDFARLGIGDNKQISDVARRITPEMAEPIWQAQETDKPFGIVPWSIEKGVIMPFVTPGYGDGAYEVRELVSGDERIGVQIEFLSDVE